MGIDSDGSNYVVMAVDQLGVELYFIDSLGAVPIIIGSVNTEGNAEKVTLTSQGVYVACDDAGAYFITIGKLSHCKCLLIELGRSYLQFLYFQGEI